MNKEQLRKEFEDCWDACEAYLSMPFNVPERDQWITTRLAGDEMSDEKLKALAENEYPYPNKFSSDFTIGEKLFIDLKRAAFIKGLECKSKPLDDGQEGKGLDIEKMIKFLDELPIETGEQFFLLKAIKQKLHEAALPVADGEVEKVFTADELEKAFYRSSNEGYQDAKINGKKFPNFHALVNYEQSKDWFKWLATKNIPK